MSNYVAKLRAESRRLKDLLRDLDQAITETGDWDSTACCPRILGGDTPVERWYLAEFFLTTWRDWESLADRYRRYFGLAPEEVPKAWKSLAARCIAWQDRFWLDGNLDNRIASSWRSLSATCQHMEHDPCTLFREIIASHHRLTLIPPGAECSWPESRAIAAELDATVQESFDNSESSVKREVLWHLRHYRHATLDASWLDEQRWFEGRSAFEHALGRPERPPVWIDEVERDLMAESIAREAVVPLLIRIVRAIQEMGFDSFRADVTSREMKGGSESPLGSDLAAIAAQSAAYREASHPIVVAIAQGLGRGRSGLPATLHRVLASLAEDAKSFAVVVCDAWDAALFADDFSPQFRELYDCGKRFAFLLVGAPNTTVTRIPVAYSVQRKFAKVAWSPREQRSILLGDR